MTYIPTGKLILRLLEYLCEFFFCDRVTQCLARLNLCREAKGSTLSGVQKCKTLKPRVLCHSKGKMTEIQPGFECNFEFVAV